MHHMQFALSTQTYGQWGNVRKLTVNRLSANAVSGLQPSHSLPNAGTLTSAVLSIPLATFSVCSVFPSTLMCLYNRQRVSSAGKVYRSYSSSICWRLRFKVNVSGHVYESAVWKVGYWQERKNATETLTPVNPKDWRFLSPKFPVPFYPENTLVIQKICSKSGQPANITPC